MRQTVETVPIKDLKARIGDLNRMGFIVDSISIDTEKDQAWLLIHKTKESK